MGQHKTNPTAQLAKEGKLPPKPKRMGKREAERRLYTECYGVIARRMMDSYQKMQDKTEGL